MPVQEAEPVETLQLVRPQLRIKRGRQRQPVDPAFEQSAHGLAPGSGLLVHDAKLRELVPKPGLESADLQRRVLVVLQRAGLFDEGAQLVQLGQVQGEVGAAGQEHLGLARGQRGEHGREGNRLALQSDLDAKVEPVSLLGGLGGDGDHRRFLGLAVVRDVSRSVHRHVRRIPERGENFFREGQCIQATELRGRGQARRAPAAGGGFAQAGDNVPRLADAFQDAGFGGVVAVAVVARVPPQRLGRDQVSGLVVPFPVQPHAVVRAVVGQEREGRKGQGGQRHRLVRGRDAGGLLELRIEAGEEAGLVFRRDVQGAAGRDEGQQLLAQTAFQRSQRDHTVRGDTGQRFPAGGQENAVRRAANGPHRRRINHFPLDGDGGRELQPAVVACFRGGLRSRHAVTGRPTHRLTRGGAVTAQIKPDGGGRLREPHRFGAAAVNQGEADLFGVGEQAPHVFPGEGVQAQPERGGVMDPVCGGSVGGQERLHPLDMHLVAFAAEVQVAQGVPGDVAADPLALGAHDHGPGLELAHAAERVAAACVGEVRGRLLDLELEGQRDAVAGLGDAGLRNERAQRLLPVGQVRAGGLAGKPGNFSRGQELDADGGVVLGGEKQRSHVLAVLADRAAADAHGAAPAARFPDQFGRGGVRHIGASPDLAQHQPGGGVERNPGNPAAHGIRQPGREGAVVDGGGLYCQCRTLVRLGWHGARYFQLATGVPCPIGGYLLHLSSPGRCLKLRLTFTSASTQRGPGPRSVKGS